MKTLLIIAILMLSSAAVYAQHGTSPEGLDTWTGQITALNADEQELTLSARKSTELFVLPKEEVKPGEKPHGPQMADLSVGQTVKVTYMKAAYQKNGKTIKRNLIIQLEIVAPKRS